MELRAQWDAAAAAVAAPLNAEIASLREQLAQAGGEVGAALATVARWQGENQRLIAERDQLTVQLDAARRGLAGSEATRREYARQLREAKRELEALEGGGDG